MLFVLILTGNVNIALHKPAWQSSTLNWFPVPVANRAVDGNNNTDFLASPCSHTDENGDPIPWLIVDLQQQFRIHRMKIFNRDHHGQYNSIIVRV